MSPRVKVLIAIAVGLMAGSSHAQLLPTWETQITLTQQDLDMMRSTVTDQIHGKPAGTTAKWSNRASRNSGSIELVKKLVRNKQQCQEIAYTVRS